MINNSTYIRSFIRTVLYPENEFQKHLFPDIESILFSHLSKLVDSSSKAKRIMNGDNLVKIENYLQKYLNLNYLLTHESQIVVLFCRHLIHKYVSFKTFDNQRVDDITQDIITILLTTKKDILRRYGKRNLKKYKNNVSFLSVIISYTYRESLQDKKYRPLSEKVKMKIDSKSVESKDTTYLSFELDEDLKRLKIILNLFYQNTKKLIMCLKCKYKIKLLKEDLKSYLASAPCDEIEFLTSGQTSSSSSEKMFETLATVLNRISKDKKTGDALNKWTSRKELEIMRKMNIMHNSKVYDKQNFKTLLEHYLDSLSQPNKHIIPIEKN